MMAWNAPDLDSLSIPFPGNNPLAPEQLRSCWEWERNTWQQQLQELRENTDDWERALDVCSQREDFGLREHMQALLPGLTLMSQHQKGWLQHIRNDLNGWLASVEKELADRTARLRSTVGALIERDGGDEWPAALEGIKAETAQLQSMMENADAAVRRLIA